MLLFIVIATEKLSEIYTANINAPAYIVLEAAPMVREYAAVRRNIERMRCMITCVTVQFIAGKL